MEKYGVTPNPGSEEAVALGCTCSVTINRQGQGEYNDEEGLPVFALQVQCPIHGFKTDYLYE